MRADFYHLARAPLERVLPKICEKLLGEGERLLVIADAGLLETLDRALWSYEKESFLPHGRASEEGAAEQPVLLSEQAEPLNGARNVALADGRWREAALGFTRAFYFFDPATVEEARGAWRSLGDKDDVERHYWKQDESGKWIEGP
jgi:DNA polymerase-3 subunit chi